MLKIRRAKKLEKDQAIAQQNIQVQAQANQQAASKQQPAKLQKEQANHRAKPLEQKQAQS